MADANAPLYAPLIPSLAQAYQYDPRRMVAESLLAQGAKAVQAPAYNPMSALAHALTEGIGGVSSAYLSNQYQDMNKQALSDFQNAESAGAGSPAVADASGNTVTPATQPNPQATLAALSKSPYWEPTVANATIQAATKLLEPQKLAPQDVLVVNGKPVATNTNSTVPIAQLITKRDSLPPGPDRDAIDAQIQKMNSEGGVQFTGNGATPVSGYGVSKGINDAQSTAVAAPAKATAAGMTAGATARATMPVDVFKQLFNPVVDKTTGEVIIPGLNPTLTKQVMAQLGVTPQQLLIAEATAAATNAVKPNVVGSNLVTKPPAAATSTLTPEIAPPQPPPEKPPIPGAQGAAGAPAQVAAAGVVPVQAVTGTAGIKPFNGGDPAKEIPSVSLPKGLLPEHPGTIIQGRDPVAIKAGEEAVEGAQEEHNEIQKAASGAVQNMQSLGALRTQIQNGVDTNALMPARAAVASYLYPVLGREATAKLMGVDPAQVDVFDAYAKRAGLGYARQTEGAREAVQAIQIALTANPSLALTKEGNLKLIDLMEAGAKHDIDAQTYSNAWFGKNKTYFGAKAWFDQNHPAAEYTSSVLPYNLPPNPKSLQPNVTYISPNHGLVKWTGNGFVPVK